MKLFHTLFRFAASGDLESYVYEQILGGTKQDTIDG